MIFEREWKDSNKKRQKKRKVKERNEEVSEMAKQIVQVFKKIKKTRKHSYWKEKVYKTSKVNLSESESEDLFNSFLTL